MEGVGVEGLVVVTQTKLLSVLVVTDNNSFMLIRYECILLEAKAITASWLFTWKYYDCSFFRNHQYE